MKKHNPPSTKAHVVRGTLYLLVLLSAFVIPLVLGQQNATNSAIDHTKSSGNIPEGGPPCTDDTWTATSITNAPDGRYSHTAIWTGTEMIVWGGSSATGHVNTGGRYNPASDTWIATGTTDAPLGREIHTAVWTGNEMIVWGGVNNITIL